MHNASTFLHHTVTSMFVGSWFLECCPLLRGMHDAGTMRARGAALVRGGGGGGAAPFLFAPPFLAAPLTAVPLVLALWGGGSLLGSLRCPSCPVSVPLVSSMMHAQCKHTQSINTQ